MNYRKLPSLELQTLAFFETAKLQQDFVTADLKWNGFRVQISYLPIFPVSSSEAVQNAFIISVDRVPTRYQRRGWLARYCQFCSLLGGDALFLMVEKFPFDRLLKSLERHGFERYADDVMMLRIQPLRHLTMNALR